MVRLTSDAEGHILSRSDSEGGELGHVGAIRGFAMAIVGNRWVSVDRKRQEAVNALLGGGDHHEDLRQYVYANGQQVGEVHAQYEMTVKWLQAGSTSVTVQAEDIVTREDGSLDRTATATKIAQRVYGLGTLEHASARQAVIDAVAARLPADDAQAQFGDSQYWYLIADANGLEGNAELKAGTTLIIPNQGTGAVNSKDTYKVYNEGDIIGATSPELRTQKKKKKWYQKLVQVIVVIINIISSVAIAYIGAILGKIPVIGPLLAAAAGYLIGADTAMRTQALEKAVDLRDDFDWKAVRESAEAGAVNGFVSSLVPKVGVTTTAGKVGVAMAAEAGRQVLTDGKITSYSGIVIAGMGPALQGAGQAGDAANGSNAINNSSTAASSGATAATQAASTPWWQSMANYATANPRTAAAGLRLVENLARGRDNTLSWTSFAVEIVGAKYAHGETLTEMQPRTETSGSMNLTQFATETALAGIGAVVIGDHYGGDAARNYFGQQLGNAIADYGRVKDRSQELAESISAELAPYIPDSLKRAENFLRDPFAPDESEVRAQQKRRELIGAGLAEVMERSNNEGMVSGNQPTSTSSLAEDGFSDPLSSLMALTDDELDSVYAQRGSRLVAVDERGNPQDITDQTEDGYDRLRDLSQFGLGAVIPKSDVTSWGDITSRGATYASQMAYINRLKALPADQNALYVEPQQIADIKESLENGKRVKYSPELNAFIDLAGIEAKTHSRSNRGGTQRYYDPSTIKQVADVLTEIGGGILPLAVGFARPGATPEAAARSMLDYTGGYASNETKYNMFDAASRVGIVDLTPGLLESAAHIDSLLPRKGYISQASYESYQQALANNDIFTVSLHDQDSTHGDRMARARLYAYRDDDLAPARLRDGARAQAEGQPWRDIFTVGLDLAFVMPWTKIGRMTAGGAKAVGGSVERFAALLNRSARIEGKLAEGTGTSASHAQTKSALGANRDANKTTALSYEDALVLKGDAARANIVQGIAQDVQPSLAAILKLDPNAYIGFRGSLANGLKNPKKLGPNGERVAYDGVVATKGGKPYTGAQGYDADFFIVSDKLATQLGNKPIFRNVTRLDSSLNDVFNGFGDSMKNNPLMSGMKQETPVFRVFTQKEIAKKLETGDAQIYFVTGGR